MELMVLIIAEMGEFLVEALGEAEGFDYAQPP
jgi:hypothetical protein